MTIHVYFPGGKRVEADLGSHIVRTDQSLEHGGEGSAPEPFELFLSSLATCAGLYVLGFCQARQIHTEGISLVQHHRFDESGHKLEAIELEVHLPEDFPAKYRTAVVSAAAACKVKKALFAPPTVIVSARGPGGDVLATNIAAA